MTTKKKQSKLAQEFFYQCEILNDERKRMEAENAKDKKEGYHNGWMVGYRIGKYDARLHICCRLAAKLGLATQIYFSTNENKWIAL